MVKKEELIIATLFRKLLDMGKIGHSHTPFENLPKGFSKDVKGEVKKVAKEFIRKSFLLASKHTYGLGTSLNNKKLEEIEQFVERYYPKKA